MMPFANWKPGKFFGSFGKGKYGMGLGLGLGKKKGSRNIRHLADAPAAGPLGLVKSVAAAGINATGKGGPMGMPGIRERIVTGESIVGQLLGIEEDPELVAVITAGKIDNQADCEAKGYFWYDDACHATAKLGGSRPRRSMSPHQSRSQSYPMDVGDPNIRKKKIHVK